MKIKAKGQIADTTYFMSRWKLMWHLLCNSDPEEALFYAISDPSTGCFLEVHYPKQKD